MIYRFVVALLQPYPLLFLLTLVTLVRLWRKFGRSAGTCSCRSCCSAIFGLRCRCRWSAILPSGSLEWRYPRQDEAPGDAGAIVVLSGYVSPPSDAAAEPELGSDTLLRCLHAVRLYKARPGLMVVSGGKVDANTPGPTLAKAMHDFLVGQGVKEKDLLLEERSSTTYQNALLSGDILTRRGISKIVLVTDASHMRQAERCFRPLGFQVVPSACDYRTTWFSWSLSAFVLPDPHAAAGVELAMHEWLGLAYYWMCGRI